MGWIIKSQCSFCDQVVDLDPKDIVLLLVPGSDPPGSYEYECPDCWQYVRKAANERVISLLLQGGVMPLIAKVPLEALEQHHGPPITHDDLLAFHQLLASDNWFDRLLA